MTTNEERLDWVAIMEKYFKRCKLVDIVKINFNNGLLKANEKKKAKLFFKIMQKSI